MATTDIETLHDHALELYVQGRYAEAQSVWETILSSAPDDPRAAEGLQMAQVLAGQREAAGQAADSGRPDSGGGSGAVSLGEAISTVEGFLNSGRTQDAVAASRILCEAHPHSEEIRALASRAAACLESEPFITGEIGRAMVALQLSDPEEARQACRQVLAIDPEHSQAHALLRLADEVVARPRQEIPRHQQPTREEVLAERLPQSRPEPAPRTSGASAEPRPAQPQPPAAPPAPALTAAAESATGTLFEFDNEALSAPPIAVAGRTVRSVADPGEGEPGGRPFAALSEELDSLKPGGDSQVADAKSARPEQRATAAEPAAPGASPMAPAAPSTSSPKKAGAFSDLDAEIDETMAAPPVEGDFDFAVDQTGTSAGGTRAGAEAPPQAASTHEPAETASSIDLDFAGEGEAFSESSTASADSSWGDLTAEVESAKPSQAARIAVLLQEAREHLDSGRYSEAIESAARSFAIDPNASGAQQLIDEARTRQEDTDHQAELALHSARKHLSEGRLDEAEVLYRKALSTHPGRREVLDALDAISRRKNELEIQAGPGSVDASPEDLPRLSIPTASSRSAARTQSGRSTMPPEVERLVPRPRPQAETPAPPPPEPVLEVPVAPPQNVTVRPDESPDRRRRLYLILGLAAGLIVLGLLGIKLVGWMKGAPASTPPAEHAAPHPGRKAKGAPNAAPISASAAGANKNAASSSQYPQTYQEAKRLQGEGKLEESRDILNHLIASNPDERQSITLLKSVQDQILQRDQLSRMMSEIESSFKQARYDDALRVLYRLPPEMQKGQIERYKANAWYDNALQFLLGGNVREAIRCLDESLALNPGDEDAKRIKEYAAGYMDREKDRAYLGFVESLPKRSMNFH